MDIVSGILLVIHMIGWAIVLGGALTSMREPRIAKGVTHGALTALVAGVLLVGMAEMGDGDVNHIKIAVKLVVALVITAMAFYGSKNEEKVTTGFLGGLAGLTVLNIAVAVLWR
ncbi:hypothetical protein [Georgenia subflava]|uniref:Integral membrane protein n=1 Tax=Georgenia subflava TaxID=1622177 RepID=A0A6N7EKI5_9MICO|nr:hypothetical protein [Georgenia subflava]MPV38649.1 hypothetical protein [Georgenia subflava]